MRQTIAVAVLLLAACPAIEDGAQGPAGPEGPAGYSPLASGTRIKTRVGVTSDGAKMFLGWFDAERQENCSFRTAADGKVRCLPDVYDSLSSAMFAQPGRKAFADPDCIVPAIPASECMRQGSCAVPTLALSPREMVVTPNGNIPAYGVFEVSGLVVGGTVYELKNTVCFGLNNSPYLTISGEAQSSDFQAMDESIE